MPATISREVRDTRALDGTNDADHRDSVARALGMLDHEIDFISHPEFSLAEGSDPSDWAESDLTQLPAGAKLPGHLRDLPGHLQRMCEVKLLTADEERLAFRRMNLLKFRANALRSRLDPDDVDLHLLETAERYLREAHALRDRICMSNLRLVISLVKKFVTPQHGFDELLSEGICSLMQAVEKFDFSRGFRFSTYAYRAISRNTTRALMDAQKLRNRTASEDDDSLAFIADDRASASSDRAWGDLREMLLRMLNRLDKREQFIVTGRYALGRSMTRRTFQSLANELGVSKERVRQLEQRAVVKLRAMAVDSGAVDLFDAACESA